MVAGRSNVVAFSPFVPVVQLHDVAGDAAFRPGFHDTEGFLCHLTKLRRRALPVRCPPVTDVFLPRPRIPAHRDGRNIRQQIPYLAKAKAFNLLHAVGPRGVQPHLLKPFEDRPVIAPAFASHDQPIEPGRAALLTHGIHGRARILDATELGHKHIHRINE